MGTGKSGAYGKEVSVVATGTIRLFPDLRGRWLIRFRNLDATVSIFVGEGDVDDTGALKGAEIKASEAVYGVVVDPDNIYAIVATGTVLVSAFACRTGD